ncbi:alpha/beta fold hydrolase [Devosia sp.]|uniref:alpha/beta fold hydrolase n=1 Tax=Devosia sp. TaxID=1871048 RepID=UPI003A9170C3
MPSFTRESASIHYEILGAGEPLLLIAGTASDGASWGPLLDLLPERQLILIDNRGSGRTTVEGPLSHRDMVEDCAALLDQLGLGAVDVVGHSLGGFLGLWLAALHPGKVKRLVTLGSGVIDARSKAVFADLSRLYFTLPPQDFFRMLYPWLFSPAFFADPATREAAAEASTNYAYRQSPADFARQVAAMERPLSVDLGTISCPVMAVAGEGDLLAPPGTVATAHAAIADHWVVTIPHAAHSIHWEQLKATAEAILGFLGRN